MRTPPWLMACVCTLVLIGCTASPDTLLEASNEVNVPPTKSFIAATLNRSVDEGPNFDLRSSIDSPTLVLWVATGCYGCHDWTAMLNEAILHHPGLNASQVLSIHRYPDIEPSSAVFDTYGNESSQHYAPWRILIPKPQATIMDAATGQFTEIDLFEAYGNPVTPTLHVMSPDGNIVWKSSSYWANQSILEEAMTFL